MYYIPQVSKSGCGFACVKMLLARAHKDERYLYLKEDENHGPYSYQDLVVIAQRYEVALIGVRYEDKDDLRHLTQFPLILTVEKENSLSHAVLVTRRKGKRLEIYDPAYGVSWQKVDKFIKKWDGTGLAINNVKEKAFTSRIIDIKDNRWEFLTYFMEFLAASFLGLATFFIKPEGSFILPLIFCALSLISEVILRMFLLKRMQKCDRYLRRFLPYVNRKDYFEYYKRAQEYKQSALTMGLNFVFYFLLIILIMVISIFNSLTFIISISASFIAALVEVFIFTPFKKNINQELEKEESELKVIKDIDDMEMKVKTMEVRSYRFAYYSFASKVVAICLFILSSFIISAMTNTFALINIVFYTCVSFLIYQYLVPLFSYDNRVQENKMAKVRINNMIHQNDENNGK